MRDIILKTASAESVIHCGAGAFYEYLPKFKDKEIFVVSDSNVWAYYRNTVWDILGDLVPFETLVSGESAKTDRYLKETFKKMAESEMSRNCTVIAIGGGVVGDLAGLAASLYMRGVKLVQVPTTLLSQVDSSVGGKTAINFGKIKNLIGTFWQPQEVICDPMFFETLPDREMRCGLGEIIKYGALNESIYHKLLKNINNLTAPSFLDEIIYDCINHKKEVVQSDERDLNGLRKTLNLGHTTGHALELYYGKKSHGEFVLIGMYYEMYIAKVKGLIAEDYYQSLVSLIKSVIKKIPAYDDIEIAADYAKSDKKNTGKKISLIIPVSVGVSKEILMEPYEYAKLLAECRDRLKEQYGKA